MDDFAAALAEAFPNEEWTPDRLSALKEAVRLCADGDADELDYDEPAPEGESDLSLVFGPEG